MRGLAFVGALLLMGLFASTARACQCGELHPATRLAGAQIAFVGVVESASEDTYTLRVEQVVKGALPSDHIALHSTPSHCSADLEVGKRRGVLLADAAQSEVITCDVIDADALLAATALPAPHGAARFVAAVQAETTDLVALGADGSPAGYGLPDGGPMALARCGPDIITASRGQAGLRVRRRLGRYQEGDGGVEIPLRNVLALGCRGEAMYAAGEGGLAKVDHGKATVVRRVRGVGAAAFTRTRAYLAGPGALHVITLSTGRERIVRHHGEFATLSVDHGRVAGRLLGGGSATLIDGRMRLARKVQSTTWLDRDRLIDTIRGQILDTLLRPIRKIAPIPGSVVAVDRGAAYVAEGNIVRRLAPGARSAKVFATLPGAVVAMTAAAPNATASWHSCDQSAKLRS